MTANNGINIKLPSPLSELEEKIVSIYELYIPYGTTQKCPNNKRFKTFLIKDLFHLPPELKTTVVHLELRISLRIFETIRNNTTGIRSEAGGRQFMKKTLSEKSRGTVFSSSEASVSSRNPLLQCLVCMPLFFSFF
jgi:hypothetical protein